MWLKCLLFYCLKNFTLVKQLHYRIYQSEIEIQLIYYLRQTQDENLLERASSDVKGHFQGYQDFKATSLFIATWEDVGYFPANDTKVII